MLSLLAFSLEAELSIDKLHAKLEHFLTLSTVDIFRQSADCICLLVVPWKANCRQVDGVFEWEWD